LAQVTAYVQDEISKFEKGHLRRYTSTVPTHFAGVFDSVQKIFGAREKQLDPLLANAAQ
jgi:hypothetical protein